MFASVYVLTFLFRGAGVVAPEASALAVAACASRTLFAAPCGVRVRSSVPVEAMCSQCSDHNSTPVEGVQQQSQLPPGQQPCRAVVTERAVLFLCNKPPATSSAKVTIRLQLHGCCNSAAVLPRLLQLQSCYATR